jgi:hypothetical protein
MNRIFPVIFLLLTLFIALPGCSRGEGGSPRQAAESFVAAMKSGKADSVWQNLSERRKKKLEEKKGSLKAAQDTIEHMLKNEGASKELSTTRIKDDKVEGEKALVTLQFSTKEGKESSKVLTLVKEKGEWKIDSLSSTEK